MTDHDKPLVTVIVPAYNHEAWVEETIMSIVNQTYGYENIQLIVTDDCSSDNTPKILSELAIKYNFELILHRQNQGICLTLNEMILLSKGRYITGIASDDILFLDKIEIQIDILKNHPNIDILAGGCVYLDKDGKIINSKLYNDDGKMLKYNFEDVFLKLKPGFPAGSTIIKRELYLRIGTYDPNYKIEDFYFWLKATHNNANITVCKRPFFYYRLHHSSISSDTNWMDEEISKILTLYREHPKYQEAIKTREIQNLSKVLFSSKIKTINYIIKNPTIILKKETIKVIIMLFLPKSILKRKFIENQFRYSNH